MANADAMFGQAATFNSDVEFALAVSDDRKAFTATFSGLGVKLDPKSSVPVASRGSSALTIKPSLPIFRESRIRSSSNNSNTRLDLNPRFGLPFFSWLIATRNRTRQ